MPALTRRRSDKMIALTAGQVKAGIKWIFRRILTGWQRPYAAFLESPLSRETTNSPCRNSSGGGFALIHCKHNF